MAQYAQSSNGRIEWVVSQGRLSESGPSSPKFTMSALDTKILKDLLCACSEEIDESAEREAKGSECAETL